MPLILDTPRVIELHENGVLLETRILNAVKIVATNPDNGMNITTLFVHEGNYDAESKIFTTYNILDEIIIDATTHSAYNLEAFELIKTAVLAGEVLTPYEVEKIMGYKHVALVLGLPSHTVV